MRVRDVRKWKDAESEHASLAQALAKGEGLIGAMGPLGLKKIPYSLLQFLSLLAPLRKILTSLLGPIGAN